MIKVSVVIPIYNGELYLDECLLSVVNQTLRDIEIICINDGSTDNSKSIIEKYLKMDPRVIYLSQSNLGVSDARNLGIFHAQGEYLHFLDQDDIIEPFMYEKMYTEAKKYDLDMVSCDIEFFGKDKSVNFELPIQKNRVMDFTSDSRLIKDYLHSFFRSSFGQGAVWNRLYKRELLLKSNRFVSRKLVKSEDTVFSILILMNVNRAMFMNDSFYKYRVRSGSQSRDTSHSDLNLNLNMIDFLDKSIDKSKLWVGDFLEDSYSNIISFNIAHSVLSSKNMSNKNKLVSLSRIFDHELFDYSKCINISIKKKVVYFIYKFGFFRFIFFFSRMYKTSSSTHLNLVDPYE